MIHLQPYKTNLKYRTYGVYASGEYVSLALGNREFVIEFWRD